jgi:hypothetical protein
MKRGDVLAVAQVDEKISPQIAGQSEIVTIFAAHDEDAAKRPGVFVGTHDEIELIKPVAQLKTDIRIKLIVGRDPYRVGSTTTDVS